MNSEQFNRYGQGSDLRKGDTRTKRDGKSHSVIHEEMKSDRLIADTGAIRTRISFPKSSKDTVGEVDHLYSEHEHVMTSDGCAENVLY